MAELIGINTPVLPTQRIENVDFTPMMMQVGNELNRKYYENRKEHLTHMNALSKVESSPYGAALLNSIRDKFNAESEEFEAQGNWHRADDFNYKMAKLLLTDPRIPAITKDKAAYDAFIKSVNESEWSTQDKSGFMLRSHHISSDLTLNANGIVEGGFRAIDIGEPYDINENNFKIFDALSKIKADKKSLSSIITNPAELQKYGLPSITDDDGKPIISHYLQRKGTLEEVTAEEVASAAMQIFLLNPDVKKTNYRKRN